MKLNSQTIEILLHNSNACNYLQNPALTVSASACSQHGQNPTPELQNQNLKDYNPRYDEFPVIR